MKRFYTRSLDDKGISGITPKVEDPLLGIEGIKFDLAGWFDDFELVLAQQWLPPVQKSALYSSTKSILSQPHLLLLFASTWRRIGFPFVARSSGCANVINNFWRRGLSSQPFL